MEDDVEVSGGGRHQEEEEVEVGVGEEAVLVDCVQQVAVAVHRQLVHIDGEVGVELGVGDLLVRRLAKHHLLGHAAARCHCVVEVPGAHQSCLPA